MAQSTSGRTSGKRRNLAAAGRLLVYVVEVPPHWRPRATHDRPPRYDVIELAGRFEASLAKQLRDEFNEAELVARRQGRPQHLWMIAGTNVKGGVA